MYLGNPLLPINISSSKAEELIKKELSKRNWVEFDIPPLKLNLVPCFLFNYHYYIESDNEGKNTIKSTVHGILAIDGHEIKLRPDLVELLKHNWKDTMQEVPRGEFVEKYCNISKNDQMEVIKLKVAHYFDIPKQNVVISDLRKLLVPFYKTTIKVNQIEYKLSINAVDGVIEGIKEVPNREKSYLEITKETINELKTPSNWIKYSKEVIGEVTSFVTRPPKKSVKNKDKPNSTNSKQSNKKINFKVFESRAILLLIILLALLLIFVSIFRIKFF
ncbi:MAG: hypothetical protein ACOX1V_01230 [Candidatus Iainarchaeum sp.]|jgi:hypothetical protein|nr:MAG: hypothetical protein BWY55_00215 [archaeon ADurb.Bin336]